MCLRIKDEAEKEGIGKFTIIQLAQFLEDAIGAINARKAKRVVFSDVKPDVMRFCKLNPARARGGRGTAKALNGIREFSQ